MIRIVYTCSDVVGRFSTSRKAFVINSWLGWSSRACLRCNMDSWKCPYALKISPSVKYCRHALRSGVCISRDLSHNRTPIIIQKYLRWYYHIYFRVKWMASSKYCMWNSTRAKFSKTSELVGVMASALRKHSMACLVSPLIRQKFPIWLNSCTDRGFSLRAFRSRRSSVFTSNWCKYFGSFFFMNRKATSGSGLIGWLKRWAMPIRSS